MSGVPNNMFNRGMVGGMIQSVVSNLPSRGSKFRKSFRLDPLTPKRSNRRFYKGNGCRNEGRHTSKGRYIVNSDKLLDIQVPDLTDFELKPYVSYLVPDKAPST